MNQLQIMKILKYQLNKKSLNRFTIFIHNKNKLNKHLKYLIKLFNKSKFLILSF